MTTEPELIPAGALTRQEPMPLAVSDPESILRYAIDKGADVAVIERLMVVRDKLKAESAQAQFDIAMEAFQSECPVIIKNVGVKDNAGKRAYSYAPIEDVEVQIRPVCHKHGFTHKFPKMILGDGTVTAFCQVKHKAGHSELTEVTYRVAAGTRMMSTTQVDAATETFCKRRALCNAYGLVLAGEDLDGRSRLREKPIGPGGEKPTEPARRPPLQPTDDAALKKQLVDLTRSIHLVAKGYKLSDDEKQLLNQFLWDEAILSDTEVIGDLAGARLAEVVAKVQCKLKAKPC